MDLAEEVEIEGGHPVVVRDAGEEVHQDQLTVAFAPVTRLLVRRSFCFRSALHDDNRGRPATSDGCDNVIILPFWSGGKELTVMPSIDHSPVLCLRT